MSSNMTRFTDAIYHRKNRYDFRETVFTRRMLKILLLIDGRKTVSEISRILSIETYHLMPEFAHLVKLGLIQTEGGLFSAGVADLFYSDSAENQPEFTMSRLSSSAIA